MRKIIILIISPKPSADIVAQKVAEYINKFRTEQGDVTATVIPGLTEYCKYRCTQLKTNFAHDTTDQRAAAEALQYGEYVDWSLYGIEGEENYYTANVREAIGKGNWGGTADEIAYSIADGFRNSKGHWSYVGSSKYTYMSFHISGSRNRLSVMPQSNLFAAFIYSAFTLAPPFKELNTVIFYREPLLPRQSN